MVELHISMASSKRWYNNELLLHRLNGPAIVYLNGTKYWCWKNRIHILDGPAIEFSCGEFEWYYQGRQIKCSTQAEFDRYIRLLPFK